MKRNHIDMPAVSNPGTSVHITWSDSGAGPITLRAYAIDTHTGVRKDYTRERKRVAKSAEEVPTRLQHLYRAVCDDIERSEHKYLAASVSTPLTPIHHAYSALVASSDPICSKWSPEYEQKNLTYFAKNVMPILATRDVDGAGNDTDIIDELQTIITEKILKSGRSAGHEATATTTAAKTLSAADTIYQRMRDIDPSLPNLSLRPRYTGRRSKNEKMKSLPRSVRRKFASLVEAFISENPRLAMGIIAMYDAGLRTAEAAAVWCDVIIAGADVTCILVRYQVKDGQRIPILKSKNAYRLTVLSTWGKAMLDRCVSLLSDDPNDGANLVCNPRLLSATIRSMLIDAGLTDNYFSAADKAMRANPDYDDAGRPIYDVAAYILRRDWASRARNVCGITSMEIDVMLGHEVNLPKKKRDDLRHLSNLAILANKLERYVHNPQYSKHPGCTPYSVQHSTELDIIPYDVIRLANVSDECVQVKLDAVAVANCDSIVIIAPYGSKQPGGTTRYIRTRCVREREPIIGTSCITEAGTFEDIAL